LNDPAVYPEPESFKPERFLRTAPDGSLTLNPEVPDPRNAVFGYGRRVCPGRHIAENTLFAGVVSFLSSMTANRPTDAYGTPEPMYEEWSSGVLDVFTKFKCTIRLRDERAASLVKEAAGGC
jgi:cytochrome P450